MPHFRIVPSLSLEQRCLVSHCTISVALLTYSSVPAASKKHSGELPEHLSHVQAVEERQSADRQIDVLIRPEQMPEIAFKGSPPGTPTRTTASILDGQSVCRSTLFGEGGQRPGTVHRNGGYEHCRGRSRRQRIKRMFGTLCQPLISGGGRRAPRSPRAAAAGTRAAAA